MDRLALAQRVPTSSLRGMLVVGVLGLLLTTLLLAAQFLVSTSPFVARIYSDLVAPRLTVFLLVGVGFALGSIVIIVLLYLTRLTLSINHLIHRNKRQLLGMSWPSYVRFQVVSQARHLLRRVTHPSRSGIAPLVLIGLACLLPFVVSRTPPADPVPSSTYLTLWQLQMGLAVAALPLLIFIIQFAEERPYSRQRTVDVLVRYTYIFPILCFVFISIIPLGLGATWLLSTRSMLIGYSLFSLSVVLTLLAFIKLLTLLFNPTTLMEKGTSLLRERFRDSLEADLHKRLGAAIMREWLDEVDAGFSYSSERKGYVAIALGAVGYVDNVYLDRLSQFLASLPHREPSDTQPQGATPQMATPTASTVDPDAKPDILFHKLYGDVIAEEDTAVLSLKEVAFDEFDPIELGRRVAHAFVVERR